MKKCFVCGKEGLELFRNTKRRVLLHCVICDIIYANKTHRKTDAIRETEKKFLHEYLQEKDLFYKYSQQILDRIEEEKKKGNILDIGSSVGLFLYAAKKRGWKVLGVEPSKLAIKYSLKVGLEVKNEYFESIKKIERKFNVVTIFQTIEHMSDPVGVLKKAREFLSSDGLLVITTPNRESMLGRFLGKRWFGYYNKEHFYFFNKQSLQYTLKQAGFRNVKVEIEGGRALRPSWILTRLTDYYYDHRVFIRKILVYFRPYWKYLDWVKLKEPAVNLMATACK